MCLGGAAKGRLKSKMEALLSDRKDKAIVSHTVSHFNPCMGLLYISDLLLPKGWGPNI